MDMSLHWSQFAGSYPLRSDDGRFRVQELYAGNCTTRFVGVVFVGRHPLDAVGPARLEMEQARRDCEAYDLAFSESCGSQPILRRRW